MRVSRPIYAVQRLAVNILFLLLATLAVYAANWAGWRGDGSGISPEQHLPVSWNATENVVWKIALPGEGNSSPIVWGNRVFVTLATAGGKQRSVLCLDAADGHRIWQRDFAAERFPTTDAKNGYASPTPVTDGTSVYAFFDSPGVVALDWNGNVRWTRDLGPFNNPYNMAESPILYRDLVIMDCDHNAGSFIVALDAATGRERWRTPRSLPYHFATPLLVTVNGKDQVIVNGNIIVAYDPLTGKELWRCKGMMPTVVPSPVAANGLVYATSGRNGPALAIDPTGSGDVSETHVRMRATTGGPYVPSPLVYPYLLLPGDNGTLRVLDNAGNILLDFRAPGHYTASPVAGDGKIYWATEQGAVYVIDATRLTATPPSLKLLALNALGEPCLASPAIAGGRLYFRTTASLYCIAGPGKATPVAPGRVTETFDALARRFTEHPAALGPDVNVRIAVVEALGQLPDPRAIPLLQEAALYDPHWDVSEAAVKSLAQIGAPATAALITVLETSKDWQPYLKVISAQALGRLQAAAAVPVLTNGTTHRDPLVRAECTRALGSVVAKEPAHLPAQLPILTARLRDTDSVVREAAAQALGWQYGASGADRSTVANALLDGAADRDPLVVKAAWQGLRSMKVSQAEITRDERLYGAQCKTPIARELRAGPIRLRFQDGELRYLYVGEKEIVRRIYFGVRDQRWDTVMPEINTIDIQQQAQAFTITLTATCRNDVADYTWNGAITGTADGRITFTVSGQANADFTSPRIGINVLYGTASLGGQSYTLLDAAGAATPGVFPATVCSDMLAKLNSFRTLRYTAADGMTVSVGLREQNFGMEDQRNFGDSSYKAMSGIAYAYPNIPKGAAGSQTCLLQVANAVEQPGAAGPIRVTLGAPIASATLPKLVAPATPPTANTFATYNQHPQQFAGKNPLILAYCPALHLADADTFIENIPTVVDWVRTLRAAMPHAKFRFDPITINAPYPRLTPDDPRNRGLFGAVWSARMLKYLGLAGVEEAAFAVGPGYARLLEQRIGAYAGKPLLAVAISPQVLAPVDVLAIQANGKRIVWLINLTDHPQQVTVADCAPISTARLTLIDQTVQSTPGVVLPTRAVPVKNDTLTVTLDAFAICEMQL